MLNLFFDVDSVKDTITNIKIDRIIIIVWSWNIVICSIMGELLSWKLILFHIGIYLNNRIDWLKVWDVGG